jgi:hypothetical protein
MKDPNVVMNTYLADMAAVEQHIHDALGRQLQTSDLQNYPEAHRVVEQLHTTLERHLATLKREMEGREGGDVVETIKKAVGGALGFIAGMYDRIRTDEVSRMIRDDYTATSLAAMSYQMLYTTALGLKNERVADMALLHLKDLTPILVELSKVVCIVVARELAQQDKIFDGTVGQRAVQATQEAWSSSATAPAVV